MKNIMLSLTISGIKNLDKDITLKFCNSRITKNLALTNSNIKGIYGENGSGKTAVITSMNLFQSICLNDRFLMDSYNLSMLNEMMNKKTHHIHFKTEFLSVSESKKYVYCYELVIEKLNTEYVITYEHLKLRAPSSSLYKTIFLVKNGEFTDMECSDDLKKVVVDKTKNLLLKSTFVSMYIDLIEQIRNDQFGFSLYCVISFFLNVVVHLEKSDEHISYIYNEYLKKARLESDKIDSDLYEKFKNLIHSDFYLKKVNKSDFQNYLKMISGMTKFIQIFKSDLLRIDVDPKEDEDTFHCNLKFVYKDYSIDSEFESTGIKKLIELYQSFYKLNYGSIVFIDELDANLHDVYLCKLLEYVGEYAQGQLCFTSHNIGPMELLSKQKYGLDFLTRNNEVVSWTKNGNYSAMKQYRSGMLKDIPFNIEPFDFLHVFGDGDE